MSAKADPVCNLSDQSSAPLEVLPAGCELTLSNGPVVFTGMSASGENNTHTVTLNQFTVTLGPSNNLVVFLSGTNQKNISPPTISSVSTTGAETETDTTSTTTPILDNATTNFTISSLLIAFPTLGNTELELDPGDLGLDHGTTTVTDLGSGNFTVSSFFDVFVDLTLDGTFGGIGSGGLPNSSGPVEMQLVLVKVPEPPSLWLLVTGLLILGSLGGRAISRVHA